MHDCCVQAFEVAIRLARGVFDMGASLGLQNMHILDIGGGFTAQVRQNLLAIQEPAMQKKRRSPVTLCFAWESLAFAESFPKHLIAASFNSGLCSRPCGVDGLLTSVEQLANTKHKTQSHS